MKLLLPLLLLLALPVIGQAQIIYATFTYITNNGAITITGAQFNGMQDEYTEYILDIPATINGLPVTSIGTNAFDDNLPIVISMTIPDSVTSIGAHAFEFDQFTGGVTIPDSVTSIGDYAFAFCDTDVSVFTVPGSVTNLGQYVFYHDFFDSVIIGNGITSIGANDFAECVMKSIMIPKSMTSIADSAFADAGGIFSITIPDSVTSIGYGAFVECYDLTNAIVGNGITSIGEDTFAIDADLTTITIGSGVTNLAGSTFYNDYDLSQVYFAGNSPIPTNDTTVFLNTATNATVYYLPGTTGWGATFDGVPTAPWFQPNPSILSFEPNFGVGTNGFGFSISWATNLSVMVQVCTNLANPVWSSVATNALVNGTSYFSDPQWTNCPARFYRLSSP